MKALKALFIGGPLNGRVKPIGVVRPTYTHRERAQAGNMVEFQYASRDLTETGSRKRWLIFVNGATPPAGEIFAMINAVKLPTVQEQQ